MLQLKRYFHISSLFLTFYALDQSHEKAFCSKPGSTKPPLEIFLKSRSAAQDPAGCFVLLSLLAAVEAAIAAVVLGVLGPVDNSHTAV